MVFSMIDHHPIELKILTCIPKSVQATKKPERKVYTWITHKNWQLYYRFLLEECFFLSVSGKPRGTKSRENKQRKIGFDVRPAGLHVVWEVGRFNHYFTFISRYSYLFGSYPSSMHHPSAQQRGMHHAIIERLYPLSSKARGSILLASRQTFVWA